MNVVAVDGDFFAEVASADRVGTELRTRQETAVAQVPPTVKKGSKGGAVKGLQNALRARSYDPGPIDGAFGFVTENAVRDFQSGYGLTADGIAGPITWQALNVYVVQSGDTLSEIAQEQLGDASRWREIFELNRALISDPDEIFPGQVLVLNGSGVSGGC
jgi:peptidoglycan hydrolase-like protein with peptidoglycan-binding domain